MNAVVLDDEMQIATLRGKVRYLEEKVRDLDRQLNEKVGACAWLREELTKVKERLSEERTGRRVTESLCVDLQQEIAALKGEGGDDD